MRKPVGVVISGVVLAVLALGGLAVSVFALSISSIVQRPLLPKIPGVRPGLWLLLAFSLLCLWTVLDLLRMRRWTRPAMVGIGLVVCLCSAVGGAALLWLRDYAIMIASVLLQGNHLGQVQAAVMGLAAFYFLIALVGLIWMVVFSRARMRAAFDGYQRLPEPARPPVVAD